MILENTQSVHENSIILESREIFLYSMGQGDEDESIDHQTFGEFLKNLRILENCSSKPIIIHQYSIGGYCTVGMAIFDVIKQSKCKFLFLCHGAAGSMGSIIPQAVFGKGYRITYPNCEWMLHEPVISTEGSTRNMSSVIEATSRFTTTMYDIYTDVCQHGSYFKDEKYSKVKSYIKRRISSKQDWYLTAKEAVEYGFADAVFGDPGYETIAKIKSYL